MSTHVNQGLASAFNVANALPDIFGADRSRELPYDADGRAPRRERDRKARIHQKLSNLSHKMKATYRYLIDLTHQGPQLHKLPAEIFLEITSYLNISSDLALSHTCQRLRQMSDVYITDLFPPTRKPKDRVPASPEQEATMREERLAFVAMLERDGKLAESKKVCSSCKKARKISLFSKDALRESPLVRKCYGHEGSLWICPHRAWDYTQVKEALAHNGQQRGSCPCAVGVFISDRRTIRVEYTLVISRAWHRPDAQKVLGILKAAKIRFCPHMCSDEPFLIDSFDQRCPELWSSTGANIYCEDMRQHSMRHCWTCQTTVHFGRHLCNHHHYVASVERKVGDVDGMYSVTHPGWISNLMQPKDVESLAQANLGVMSSDHLDYFS